MSSVTHQLTSVCTMLIFRKEWEHLGLNTNHSGKVLHSVFIPVISSVDPRKRYRCPGDLKLHSQLIDATIQGIAVELETPMKAIRI